MAIWSCLSVSSIVFSKQDETRVRAIMLQASMSLNYFSLLWAANLFLKHKVLKSRISQLSSSWGKQDCVGKNGQGEPASRSANFSLGNSWRFQSERCEQGRESVVFYRVCPLKLPFCPGKLISVVWIPVAIPELQTPPEEDWKLYLHLNWNWISYHHLDEIYSFLLCSITVCYEPVWCSG